MGNVYMEADQVRFKNSTYHNLQTAVSAALEGGGGGGTTVVANPEGSATADLAKLQVGTTIYGIPAEAGDISYDNTSSGMTADDVQEAIDELNASIPGVATTSAPGIVQPDGTTVTITDGVISAVGGSGSGEIYSTTETVIGAWLGSTFYRKVIELPAMPNNTSKQVQTGLSNVNVVKLSGIAKTSDGSCVITLPYNSTVSAANNITFIAENTGAQIAITAGSDRSAFTSGYAVLEYTKNS